MERMTKEATSGSGSKPEMASHLNAGHVEGPFLLGIHGGVHRTAFMLLQILDQERGFRVAAVPAE